MLPKVPPTDDGAPTGETPETEQDPPAITPEPLPIPQPEPPMTDAAPTSTGRCA